MVIKTKIFKSSFYIICSVYVHFRFLHNHIGCVMVSMLALSAVDCGFKPPLDQTTDNKIGICCFSTKHQEKDQRLVGSESG